MKRKIFVLTGETSGDKLASKVIAQLKRSRSDIEYLSVGGEHLKALGIKSIYDLKEVTYLGFTRVLLNIFKIKKKINDTVKEIIKFKPDILFSVDSPDFTLRVAKEVKKNNPNIKTIHFVAPQVWVWRERRIKQLKSFLDHVLLLFPFEKKYFDKENIQSTFTGHPLLEEQSEGKIDINQFIKNEVYNKLIKEGLPGDKIFEKDKRIFSIFAGSRPSEFFELNDILCEFIKLMNKRYNDIFFVFHTTHELKDYLEASLISKLPYQSKKKHWSNEFNYTVISDEKIKSMILKKSTFAVSKSGTVSLEICNAKVPSIIIYKMNKINFFIVKMLVKVKFANIINIAANEEIIPELLQSNCNSTNIYNTVDKLLNDKWALEKQVTKSQEIISNFKTERSSEIASSVIENYF